MIGLFKLSDIVHKDDATTEYGSPQDVIEESAIATEAEYDIALTQALDARNRCANRSGHSAYQRVFGTSLRLPGSLLSDDPVDRMVVASDPSTEFQRAAEIRDAATKAMFKNQP